MTREELLEIGIDFRGGKFPNIKTWNELNDTYGNEFVSGEAFRSFVKKELKKQEFC